MDNQTMMNAIKLCAEYFKSEIDDDPFLFDEESAIYKPYMACLKVLSDNDNDNDNEWMSMSYLPEKRREILSDEYKRINNAILVHLKRGNTK